MSNMWLVFGECGGGTVTLVEKEEQQRTNLRGMIREYLEEFTIFWLPSSSLLICRISILSRTQTHPHYGPCTIPTGWAFSSSWA